MPHRLRSSRHTAAHLRRSGLTAPDPDPDGRSTAEPAAGEPGPARAGFGGRGPNPSDPGPDSPTRAGRIPLGQGAQRALRAAVGPVDTCGSALDAEPVVETGPTSGTKPGRGKESRGGGGPPPPPPPRPRRTRRRP
ncbi:hypothetical protein [Frankia sp. AiPa1]|uniref:hypothetical protein n=1 Tax=Frankia sp. AiPa1 TaxID=573492 RepID=UPI00202B8120|nr:hypothetical protein [Frankia sp. AiPa1]MCL9761719.1 hypothetical protein [Frankia sp. AiPa1]